MSNKPNTVSNTPRSKPNKPGVSKWVLYNPNKVSKMAQVNKLTKMGSSKPNAAVSTTMVPSKPIPAKTSSSLSKPCVVSKTNKPVSTSKPVIVKAAQKKRVAAPAAEEEKNNKKINFGNNHDVSMDESEIAVSKWCFQPLTVPDWQEALKEEMQQPYFIELQAALNKRGNENEMIYPPAAQLWTAFGKSVV